MTATLLQEGFSPDAELVAESRRGNREAFGRIVRRHQGMVAGVIYSVCGDLHRSEDLAQETFLSAWKSLSGMNDPEKLSPWLCQIARRKAIDFQRSNQREKNRLSHLFPVLTASKSTSPPEEALANEEREMLWRILSELPQRYRETMVLYYRQGQSTAAVALATGMTEDAVRQRLTRGRDMLRDQMAEILERNLVRSAPAPAFAVAVMAALPALTPPAAKAATLGAAAKGSTLLGGGGAMVWASALFGPLVALGTGIFALRRELRVSQSRRERRFLILFSGLVALCLAALCALWGANLFASRLFQVHYYHGLVATLLPIGITVVAVIAIRMGRRRRYAIRISEPSDNTARITPFAANPGKMPLVMVVVVVFASMSGWFDFAWRARDFLSIAILSILAIGLTIVAAYCWGGNSIVRSRRFSLLILPILAVITLSLMKWRQPDWIRVIYHQSHTHPVPSSVLISMAMFFVGAEVVVMELVGVRRRKRPSKDVSVGPVRQRDLTGFSFLYVDTQVTLKTISQTAGEEVPKLFAAIKAANIQPRGPVVFIYPKMTGDPNVVLDVKIGIALKETPATPEGYQVDEIPPVTCKTVLYGGPMTGISQAFHVLGPALGGGAAAPTGEIRVYCLYFEDTHSPNNVTQIAAVVK